MFLEICMGLEFPEESIDTFEAAFVAATENSDLKARFERAKNCFLYPNEIVFGEVTSELAKATGVNIYTLFAVLCAASFEELSEMYEKAGKRDMLDTFVENLKPQLIRCKEEHGVWGIEDGFWQWMFHELWCERLGRLEFEPFHHFCEQPYRGIKKGDPVILIHIPRGNFLDIGEVMESIAMGYERYKDRFKDEIVPFMTHSWLLYPPFLREVFKEGGNLQKFAELFDIISQNEAGYQNFPNVFGCRYPKDGDFSAVPQNTSMQRSMLEFIKRGNLMGEGYGIFLYGRDGILKR